MEPDILIESHGTVFLVRPQTDAARKWLLNTAPSDAQWFCGALAVEARFVFDVCHALKEAGFSCE